MKSKQIGQRITLSFNLDERELYNRVFEKAQCKYFIETIFINNGYCLELTPKIEILKERLLEESQQIKNEGVIL